jgi:hypothetical protein
VKGAMPQAALLVVLSEFQFTEARGKFLLVGVSVPYFVALRATSALRASQSLFSGPAKYRRDGTSARHTTCIQNNKPHAAAWLVAR